jgi:hypothetical protein
MLTTLGLLAVGILAFAVYLQNAVGNTPGTAATPTPSSNVSAQTACTNLTFGPALTPLGANAGKKSYTAAPAMGINSAHKYLATIKTAKGTITLCLDPSLAPNTVNNFVFLARNQFYDGLKFHRVEPSFVIQGGRGDGEFGPKHQRQPVLHLHRGRHQQAAKVVQPVRLRGERHGRGREDRGRRRDDVGDGPGTERLISQPLVRRRLRSGRIMGAPRSL